MKVLTATDLHRGIRLYGLLRDAVAKHQPDILALVGDFLHAYPEPTGRFTTEETARFLSGLDCGEILFVRGNHEDEAWWDFAVEWRKSGRPLHALHGEVFVKGPLVVVGFPCFMGVEEAFLGSRRPLPFEPTEWLPGVLRPWGQAARTLWLMHEPPAGTPLSQWDTAVAGNLEWVPLIEQFRPWLTVSGHDHLTPIRSGCWRHRIGSSTCVNAGQTDAGPLHYCLIEAEFPDLVPCLPSRMQVTAFPFNESVRLPDEQ